jgi:two-component system response regulator
VIDPPTGQILLVEDNPDHAALVLRALKKHNVANDVALVIDGEEALDYLFATGSHADRDPEELPVLMVLDLKLPKIDGLEVLQRVRAEPRTRRLPVVILTSSDEESDIAGSYDRGANGVVRKPVQFDDFSRAVGTLSLYWVLINEPPPPNLAARAGHG